MSTFFDENRVSFAEEIESDLRLDSVDRLEFNREGDTVILAVTSGWASADRQQESAWEIARLIAGVVYGAADWQNEYYPILDLTVDAHHYVCPGDVMLDVAERRASRTDWEAGC